VRLQPHTAKADLWSVGVLVYKMLTDDFPFPASNPRQVPPPPRPLANPPIASEALCGARLPLVVA
jgi:serine/threonine protein kinase